MGLRADIEEDLLETLEEPEDFGLPVVLIAPDGTVYNTSENDDGTLYGRIVYDTIEQDEDGNEVIVHKPMVTLRLSSLARVPENGETWVVKIPDGPRDDASVVSYILERAPEDGRSIGYINLYLRKTEQSS